MMATVSAPRPRVDVTRDDSMNFFHMLKELTEASDSSAADPASVEADVVGPTQSYTTVTTGSLRAPAGFGTVVFGSPSGPLVRREQPFRSLAIKSVEVGPTRRTVSLDFRNATPVQLADDDADGSEPTAFRRCISFDERRTEAGRPRPLARPATFNVASMLLGRCRSANGRGPLPPLHDRTLKASESVAGSLDSLFGLVGPVALKIETDRAPYSPFAAAADAPASPTSSTDSATVAASSHLSDADDWTPTTTHDAASNPLESSAPEVHSSRPAGSESSRSPAKSKVREQQNKDTCFMENCRADLANAKTYCKRLGICGCCIRRHSLCVKGREMRFCQQCSQLHPVEDFDGYRHSCREKLARHAARVRRSRAALKM